MPSPLYSLAILLAFALNSAASADSPNILFVFADDLTYEAIGAAEMLDIETPHLDQLAKQGTRFTHAYNMGSWSGAVCVASRTMLNTGRFVWNARTSDLGQCVAENQFWSQRMHEAGYQTYMTGKWHVSTKPDKIFDVVKNVRAGMPNQTPAGYNRPKDADDYASGWKPWDPKHGGFWEGGRHWSEVVADDSVEYLQQAAEDDKPFFMYLAFNAPHDPRQAPKEYVDRYPLDRIKTPENMLPEYPHADAICGKGLRDEKLIPYPRTEFAVKVNRQEYFALITHMDDQIGRILDALKKTGKADDTYIFFTADHGLAVGHHGLVGKQNMYDHSVRVPFIVTGPNIKAGVTIETPIYLQDVMATSLELAGDAKREGIEFKSLMPLLRNETTNHYDDIYGAYLGNQRMITYQGWKLIHYPKIGVSRLYDLNVDPQEMNDLAADPKHAAKLKQLTARLEAAMDAIDDPMTTLEEADYLISTNDAQEVKPSKKSKSKPNAQPAAETVRGPWAITPDPKLPNVLILGDSISIGYTLKVREALQAKANVFRPCSANGMRAENCNGTTNGVQKTDGWLTGQKWDVIHFNFGLHDLKHVSPTNKNVNSNSLDDPRQAEPQEYRENLSKIVAKLKATGAKLIYATTTSYPDGCSPARLPADANVYNNIATEIMRANDIEINDLHAACHDRLSDLQLPKNVHFNGAGEAFQAKIVADAIERALP
jgi:choline-sulfatase